MMYEPFAHLWERLLTRRRRKFPQRLGKNREALSVERILIIGSHKTPTKILCTYFSKLSIELRTKK